MPRTPKNRNPHADSWQKLASIKVFLPGRGAVTVEQMLESISASAADLTTRKQLSLELGNFATLLESLPPATRDGVVEWVADVIRETYERDEDAS